MSYRSTEDILGYAVYSGTPDACAEAIVSWVDSGDHPRWLACMNPHSFAVAEKSKHFGDALRSADWLVPDGVGVVLASRLGRGAIRERITGTDVFSRVMGRLHHRGGARVFFLGSTDAVLASIRERATSEYPNVEIVGTYSPPYKAEFSASDLGSMESAINAAKPDVLWVGMTAPKQELWIHGTLGRLDIRFAAAIGAVFDFYAGTVKRPHPVFQRFGLEWLPRLIHEPSRLWRRTLISAPMFVWHIVRSRVPSVRKGTTR